MELLRVEGETLTVDASRRVQTGVSGRLEGLLRRALEHHDHEIRIQAVGPRRIGSPEMLGWNLNADQWWSSRRPDKTVIGGAIATTASALSERTPCHAPSQH
jgi:hypothetical protein